MTDRKGARRSERPLAGDDALKLRRSEFVQTFFKKGAEFTEELVRENERLRTQLVALEKENAALRTQLASDTAIRDLLAKIEQLEKEKEQLLGHWQKAEATTSRYSARFAEIEGELENFATLYVASHQLHSTLRVERVVKHLKELLVQLVGARSLAFYVLDGAKRELVPLTSEGVSHLELPILVPAAPLGNEPLPEMPGANAIIERVFLTGVPYIRQGTLEGAGSDDPAACVPMKVEEAIVGVIVIYSVLAQKRDFVPVDFELFKLLGAHAGTALVGAQLYERVEGNFPSLETLRNVVG